LTNCVGSTTAFLFHYALLFVVRDIKVLLLSVQQPAVSDYKSHDFCQQTNFALRLWSCVAENRQFSPTQQFPLEKDVITQDIQK
jgi:hypothetical protein